VAVSVRTGRFFTRVRLHASLFPLGAKKAGAATTLRSGGEFG
jgi:hypothetical protein